MKILNKRHYKKLPYNSIYIGRPSKWGNPFIIGKDGDREEVILKYKEYLFNSGLIDDIHEIEGKDLVCWCSPLPCHGDILKEILEYKKEAPEDASNS